MPRQRFFLFGTRCNLVRSLRNKHSFYFITKPMFKAIDYFFRWTGNFGLAILIVTVLVKLLFFPLANKSYASMAKMKAVQPEMVNIRERYADDKVKQQQVGAELALTSPAPPWRTARPSRCATRWRSWRASPRSDCLCAP